MRRPAILFLVTLLSACLWGCAAPASAAEVVPPAVPDPAPSTAASVHTRWAKHWAAQAAKNRRPLMTLKRSVGLSAPAALATRPAAGAGQRAWTRYGVRSRRLAVTYTRQLRSLRQRLRNPVTLGRLLAWHLYGWRGSQWTSLYLLWRNESGWRAAAANPCSSAYGIPQSCPGSKMARFGSDWRTNPWTQIRWGLWYIHSRYGSPAAAWAQWTPQTGY